MADIKKIEIICTPCHTCEVLINNIQNIMHFLADTYHFKARYEFYHHHSKKDIFRVLTEYGISAKQLPVVLINGEVAFAGRVKGEALIRTKLLEFLKL